MATGGFMTIGSAPWYAQFSTEQLAVIVAEARRVDKPVAAHAHGLEGMRRAVAAGVSSLEHCSFVTETNERYFDEPLAERIAERGIVVCPTINVNAPYVSELTGIEVGQYVKSLHDMGVRIIAGTGCAGWWRAAATTRRTAAVSTSAPRGRRTRTRITSSVSGC